MKVQQYNQHLFLEPALIGLPSGAVVSVPHPSGWDKRTIPWKYSAITSYNGRGGTFRPCRHNKADTHLSGSPADMFVSTSDIVRFVGNTRNWAINSVVDSMHSIAANRPADYIITDEVWNDHASDAMEAMRPSLTSNNSLINFILEVKDFKRYGAGLVNLFKDRKTIEANIRDALKRRQLSLFESRPWNHRGPRSSSQKVSDAWLEWKLAWSPFVNDVRKLVSGITSFNRDVRQFLQREGKQQQRYWGKSLENQHSAETVLATGSYVPPELYPMNNLDTVWRWTLKETVVGDPRFYATTRYRYLLNSRLRSEAGALNGFLDRLGINGNPAILWNAIPFTFVVDWFVNIGGYLNKLRVDNIQPVTEISDFCSSVKSERRLELVLRGDILQTSSSGAVIGAVPEHTAISMLSSSYRREASLPRTSLAFGNGLSGTRLVTAAALINSIRR